MWAILGSVSFESTIKGRSPKRAPRRTPVLHVLYSPVALGELAETIPLAPGQTRIGRAVADEGGIALPDPRVSRFHATVTAHRGEAPVQIADTSSTGTTVNGTVVDRAVLEDGDLIRVGDTMLLFRRLPDDLPDAAIPTIV